jgi:hypothetical protein
MAGAPVAVGVAVLLAVLSGVTGVAVAAVKFVRGNFMRGWEGTMSVYIGIYG